MLSWSSSFASNGISRPSHQQPQEHQHQHHLVTRSSPHQHLHHLVTRSSPCCRSLASPSVLTTGPERALRTPHSGYHFDGTKRRFFEGWYFKVSIPQEKQSFAWMYSVEDPAFSGNLSELERLRYGPRFPGVGAQVLGADDGYLFQYSEDTRYFWGSRHELALGNTFKGRLGKTPPVTEVKAEDFRSAVEEGFQVTPVWHQGFLSDNGRSPDVKTLETCKWEYSTRPVYGWGDTRANQKATAGWLAALPVFEPHWQICMAGGLSTGWIEWGNHKFEFEDAPSYSEKNWGGSFPTKWFWIQCNVFEGGSGDIALTAGGGRRGLPFMSGLEEEVAMVGIHYGGKFYEFVPWNGPVEWEISTWGFWHMKSHNALYEVELEATTKESGTTLRAPTADAGLAPFCKDTFCGNLKLQLWERTATGKRGKVILDVTSDMAALEVGGGPWYTTWKRRSETSSIIKPLIGLPINVESLFTPAPAFKPPGL